MAKAKDKRPPAYLYGKEHRDRVKERTAELAAEDAKPKPANQWIVMDDSDAVIFQAPGTNEALNSMKGKTGLRLYRRML